MKKTLYLKFILAYFIFGVFGFIIVTTFVPNMTKEHLIREKAESLYSEATLIAGTYAGGLYTSETTLETVKMQLDSLAVYLNSEIRIINPSGRLVLDTNSPLDVENVVVIENFDSTVTSGSYYIVGDFFGNFDSDVLTVFAPITSNYKVKGYVVIHTDMNDIPHGKYSGFQRKPAEYFLYHPGNPVPAIPDHSDLFHRDRIYSSAEDHSCHRAVCRR